MLARPLARAPGRPLARAAAMSIAALLPPYVPPEGMVATLIDEFTALSLREGGPTQAGYRDAPAGRYTPRSDLDTGADPDGWQPDDQQSYFVDPAGSLPSPFAVSGGVLSIKATKVGETWRTGFLHTGHSFAFHEGRLDVPMRAAPGSGTVSAIWLISPDAEAAPEIDIEVLGEAPNMVHLAVNRGAGFVSTDIDTGRDLTAQLNRFGIERTRTQTIFYLDDEELWSVDNEDFERMRQPLAVRMSLHIGLDGVSVPADETTPSPTVMQVARLAVAEPVRANLWAPGDDFAAWEKYGLDAGTLAETDPTVDHGISRMIAKAPSIKTYRVSVALQEESGRPWTMVASYAGGEFGFDNGIRQNYALDTGTVATQPAGYGGDPLRILDGSPAVMFQPDGTTRVLTYEVESNAAANIRVSIYGTVDEDDTSFDGDPAKRLRIAWAELVELA